ncbi:MAG: putative peptidoglycan glycosyltransferase FtsW [bacterium]|nr:putative peptidoglycan glycosyltransferase FtsW [bacterium]
MPKHVNYYLLALVVFLVGFGALFLATLSAPSSLNFFGNTNHYLFAHLARIGAGIVAGFIFFKLPLKFLKNISPVLFFLNLFVLGIVFIPFFGGTNFWGATRWLSIGGITFQPSEFLKITAILYLAALISNRLADHGKGGLLQSVKKGYGNFVHVFVPFLILLGVISIILILQPDISTLGIIAISLVAMYFAAKTPLWHVLALGLAGVAGGFLLIYFKPYRAERLLVFLHPETDPLGIGFQMKQSLIAIGSGGWFGKGIGMSVQKFGFLPQAMSDSVFAILGEETGIIGCTILIALFLLFFYLGYQIATKATDKFAKLTAIGITFMIVFQAFLNITSTIGLFPLSGLPLPFFSYGGSHLITELIGVGLLLNISRNG